MEFSLIEGQRASGSKLIWPCETCFKGDRDGVSVCVVLFELGENYFPSLGSFYLGEILWGFIFGCDN